MPPMTDRRPWVPAFPLDELPVGGARLFSSEERRIAVFRTGEEEAYAIDNRCPHEGYPLVRGYVKDCVVTCIWHNFKFDVRDGRCVIGEEHVRSYPLRISGGRIELDLTDPDPSIELAERYASLGRGVWDRRLGQVARDLVRLLQLGARPLDLAFAAAALDATYAEYGTTHALPVAVDTLTMMDRYPGVEAVLPLMQAFDLVSESHQRSPRRVAPAAVDPGDDPRAAGERLFAAVEAEEAATAEGLLRGALARGWGREVIEPWLYRLGAAHFLDFGHETIYLGKLLDLVDRVGWQRADEVVPAYLFRIINGTREELVPEWKWLCDRLAQHSGRFAAWSEGNRGKARDAGAGAELLAALIAGGRERAIAALVEALERGAGLENVADALVLAGAERVLRFDERVDGDPTVQEGWLDVTHRFTYACAVAEALRRYAEPDGLRMLFFAAYFIVLAAPVDLPEARRVAVTPVVVEGEAEEVARAVVAAALGRDAARAVGLAAGFLRNSQLPVERLRVALEDATLRSPAVAPIFVAHLIKNCVAAFAAREELAGHPGRDVPVLAFVRYLATPACERSVTRLAHEAIGFVVHGKVPRTLT